MENTAFVGLWSVYFILLMGADEWFTQGSELRKGGSESPARLEDQDASSVPVGADSSFRSSLDV